MKNFIIKYRSLGSEMVNGSMQDDVLKTASVEATSSFTASRKLRSMRSDVHYIVSVTEA